MILVDSREPEIIAKALDCAQVVTLPHGDYQFWGYGGKCILIERKTVSDALSSLTQGRLQTQLREMLTLEDTISHLLIEGYWTCTGDFNVRWNSGVSGWKLSSFIGHLLTFQHEGVRLVYSPNLDATIYLLKSLYDYYQKPEHSSINTRPKPLFEDSDEYRRILLLTSFPGVGEKLARAALEQHSILDILVNPHILEDVKGFGTKRIKAIERILGLTE